MLQYLVSECCNYYGIKGCDGSKFMSPVPDRTCCDGLEKLSIAEVRSVSTFCSALAENAKCRDVKGRRRSIFEVNFSIPPVEVVEVKIVPPPYAVQKMHNIRGRTI